jgi:hypothetical protein
MVMDIRESGILYNFVIFQERKKVIIRHIAGSVSV